LEFRLDQDDFMNGRSSWLTSVVLGGFALAGGAAGCNSGPAIGDVKGRVTFEGKPVTEGSVSFFNPSLGTGADAPLQGDGMFVIKTQARGLPVGEYIVFITPETYLDKSDPTTPPARVEKNPPDIPKKYRRQGTTPLKATVEAGNNEFHFEMKR
jgi:hypothetical protein